MTKGREELADCFETLELPIDASFLEVRKSYSLLKELYSKGSIVTLPLEEELTKGQRKAILGEIEEAYGRLLAFFEQESSAGEGKRPPQAQTAACRNQPEIDVFDGGQLRQAREGLGIDIQDVAFDTKISVQQLRNIEEEKYADLPPEVYTRGFVASYAKFLSLDPARVAADYMRRYRAWKGSEGKE